jgi:hypothetical protein
MLSDGLWMAVKMKLSILRLLAFLNTCVEP